MHFLYLVRKILSKHIDRVTGYPEVVLIGWVSNKVAEEHLARYMIAQQVAYGTVLDVASGSGYGSSILSRSKRVRYVVSVDIDINLLRYGKEVFHIEAVCADAMRLPFRDKSFDIVVSMETIEHLPMPVSFVKELARVLRVSGILVLSTPNKLYASPFVKKPLNSYHLCEFYLGELLRLLEKGKFKPLLIVCGKPFSKINFIRKVFGTLVKTALRIIGVRPIVIDIIYRRITRLREETSSEYIEPLPQRVVHKPLKEYTNISFCEYFIVIAKIQKGVSIY